MASHNRIDIVLQNVLHLLSMGQVFIVVSEKDEYERIKLVLPANVYLANNNPLGNKWQIAVNHAYESKPDCIITCGSDDFLSNDYVLNAMKLLDKGYDFIGVNGWYMSDGKQHFKAKYRHRQDFPAGSGRVFTKKCLDAIGWELFDRKADRLLDDRALERIKKNKINSYISQDSDIDGLKILALKGNWPVMNPLKKFLCSPTIRISRINKLPKEFPKIEL